MQVRVRYDGVYRASGMVGWSREGGRVVEEVVRSWGRWLMDVQWYRWVSVSGVRCGVGG